MTYYCALPNTCPNAFSYCIISIPHDHFAASDPNYGTAGVSYLQNMIKMWRKNAKQLCLPCSALTEAAPWGIGEAKIMKSKNALYTTCRPLEVLEEFCQDPSRKHIGLKTRLNNEYKR